MSKYLYDWDSVGYALAFSNYNITLHQPQPPGYILYITMGKTVNFLFNDPNFSMIFLNIILTILTVVVIYFLAKEMFSRNIAIITSILLVFSPFFWFYGEIASVYMMGAFFATLIAYTSYHVLKGNDRFIYISAAVLGISGGFRQDLTIFMLPLWLFCILYINRDYKRLLMALIILIASIMVWFIPNLILAGGYESYSMGSSAILLESFSSSSMLFGADLTSQLSMDFRLIAWTALGIGIVSVFISILFIFYKFKKVFSLSCLKKVKTLFLSLWIIPSFLFYLIFYIAKPGYILIYLPAFILIVGYVLLGFSTELNKNFNKIPRNYFVYLLVFLCIASGTLQFMYPSHDIQGGIVDYGKIQTADRNMQSINQSLNEFSSNDTVIFMSNEDNWRKTIYYFPDYESFTYYSRVSAGKTIYGLEHYRSNQTSVSEDQILSVQIDSNKNRILWLIDNTEFLNELKTRMNVRTSELSDGEEMYYSKVEDVVNFRIYNFEFYIK